MTSGECCDFFQVLDFTSALTTCENIPPQREEIQMKWPNALPVPSRNSFKTLIYLQSARGQKNILSQKLKCHNTCALILFKSCDEATARVMVTFEGDGYRYFGANTPL